MSKLNPNARLMIVDDSVANISMLQNILNRVGYTEIDAITDSRLALARVESFRPDLIMLDLNMPYMDGFEVMQQLARVIPRDTFLPVMVLTGDTSGETKRKALLAGATDIVTKPFHAAEVFMRIRNLLQIRFLHRQLQQQNQTLEAKVEERTQELREMQQQVVAQERLHAFAEMAGGVVHDFNNALMSVIGYSDILLDDEALLGNVEIARGYLRIMNRAGRDASEVIGRLRDFYRPREVTDVFYRVDMNEIVEQAVALTQPKWKGQALAEGRTIKVDLDLAKLPPVQGNSAELREVTTNLIFNAVDAMPDGGTIVLRTSAVDGQAVIEISDTGLGMSEEVRRRCLEPFFSTKGDKGTGLGLSMVFGIIKRHEGTLDMHSAPGRGTTFRIRLPAASDALEAVDEDTLKMDRSLRVLVVDDEAATTGVIEQYLTSDGHQVTTAANAGAAIGCWEGREFDVLITDHAMPGMNGVQLAAHVSRVRAGQPIILMTGFAPGGLGKHEEPPGVSLVMRKPVLLHELRRALVSVTGG